MARNARIGGRRFQDTEEARIRASQRYIFAPAVIPGTQWFYFDTVTREFRTQPSVYHPRGQKLDVLEMMSNSWTAPLFTLGRDRRAILFRRRRIGLDINEQPPRSMRSLPNSLFGREMYVMHHGGTNRLHSVRQRSVLKGHITGTDPLRELQAAGYRIIADMPV